MEGLTARVIQMCHEEREESERVVKAFQDVRNDISRVRESFSHLGKERQTDLVHIGDLMKESAKQTIHEVMTDISKKFLGFENCINQLNNDLRDVQ